MKSTFGERLRDLRTSHNLLQSEFGSEFGLSPSAIGSYERNEREPAYHHLIAFADFFNVSLDYLMGRSDERLTVEDYTARDEFQLAELLDTRTIFLNDRKLTEADKQMVWNVCYGLFFGGRHKG